MILFFRLSLLSNWLAVDFAGTMCPSINECTHNVRNPFSPPQVCWSLEEDTHNWWKFFLPDWSSSPFHDFCHDFWLTAVTATRNTWAVLEILDILHILSEHGTFSTNVLEQGMENTHVSTLLIVSRHHNLNRTLRWTGTKNTSRGVAIY